ncbi:MAG TPA: glycosyltransferase family 9 protein [Verrucomicrobiae bacterium]|nr:glycosyltransferase family 9 protein [Verrucomicrobiae bacterium]
MKILVISLAGIGDTVLATPLIRELRANFPQAQLDALVRWAGARDVLHGNPNLNTVYQQNLMSEPVAKGFSFLRSLRSVGYDISINAHPQSRIHYRAIARFIGAKIRISHVYEGWGLLDRILVNRTVPQDYSRHTVENNLALLPLIGKTPLIPKHELEICLSSEDTEWAGSFLTGQDLTRRKRLGLHVGSGRTKNLALKRWPLERYIELLGILRRSHPELAILLFGGPDEEEDLGRIQKAHPSPLVLRVHSKTLGQAAALMQRCSAFLSVDTVHMHLAAAVKAPGQIVIEAPTLNKTNEPFGNPFTVVKNPAVAGKNLDYYRYDGRGIKGSREDLIRCMESVSVSSVHRVVESVLGGNSA